MILSILLMLINLTIPIIEVLRVLVFFCVYKLVFFFKKCIPVVNKVKFWHFIDLR